MQSLSIALVLAMCSMTLVVCFEQELRDFTLDLHNGVRKGVGACQMNKLRYDMELEKQATGWAKRCRFEHEVKNGRGENLAWNSHHAPEKKMIQEAMDLWYDEINLYTYGQHSCSQSCHYTQLVWSTIMKVGCATHRCANLANAGPDAWFLVCFYTPGANYNGEKPYKQTCDKPCLEGQTLEDGLCAGEPKGEDSIVEKCEDHVDRCEEWASKGQCDKNPVYMAKKCPVSCSICEGEKYKAPKGQKACHDADSGCPGWAKRGLCRRNPGYMGNHCKKSCKLC